MQDTNVINIINAFAENAQKYIIAPQDIKDEDKEKSYKNITRELPKNNKKIKNRKSNVEESQIESQTESNMSNIGSNTEGITDGQMSQTESKCMKKNKLLINHSYKHVIYGQHKDYSFYKCYAREIIFQLFNYPRMSFSKYSILLDNSQENNLISDWTLLITKKKKSKLPLFLKKTGANYSDDDDEEKNDKYFNKINSSLLESKKEFNFIAKKSYKKLIQIKEEDIEVIDSSKNVIKQNNNPIIYINQGVNKKNANKNKCFSKPESKNISETENETQQSSNKSSNKNNKSEKNCDIFVKNCVNKDKNDVKCDEIKENDKICDDKNVKSNCVDKYDNKTFKNIDSAEKNICEKSVEIIDNIVNNKTEKNIDGKEEEIKNKTVELVDDKIKLINNTMEKVANNNRANVSKIQENKNLKNTDKNVIINNDNEININTNIKVAKNEDNMINDILNIRKERKNKEKKEKEKKRAQSVLKAKIMTIKEEKQMKLIPRNLSNNDLERIKYMDPRELQIDGDFDFLIHSLEASKLEEVLNNKDVSPFIYYGNFLIKDLSEKYDIIGEIKESSVTHEGIIQITKYIQLIYSLNKSEELNKNLGFKKENKKILMYVFNSSFQKYLQNILDFKINQKKFKKKNKFLKEIPFYNSVVDTFNNNNNNRQKNKLMNIIIESCLPFIFIFVPNVKKMIDIKTMTIQQEIQAQNKEILEKLNKQALIIESMKNLLKQHGIILENAEINIAPGKQIFSAQNKKEENFNNNE